MTKRLLSLMLGMALGAIVMMLAYNRNYVPGFIPNEPVRKLDSLKRKAHRDYDSLSSYIERIHATRHLDSLRNTERLNSNKKEIQKLQHAVKEVSFKEYTDLELDSLVNVLYPRPN